MLIFLFYQEINLVGFRTQIWPAFDGLWFQCRFCSQHYHSTIWIRPAYVPFSGRSGTPRNDLPFSSVLKVIGRYTAKDQSQASTTQRWAQELKRTLWNCFFHLYALCNLPSTSGFPGTSFFRVLSWEVGSTWQCCLNPALSILDLAKMPWTSLLCGSH